MNLKDTSPDAIRKLREEFRAADDSTLAAAIWADILERKLIADGAQSNPWGKSHVDWAFREGVAWADTQRNKGAKFPNGIQATPPLPLDPDSPMTGAMLFQTYWDHGMPVHSMKWNDQAVSTQTSWVHLASIIQRTRNAALESMTEQRNKLREELGQVRADFHQINSEKAVMHTEINQLKRDLHDARYTIEARARKSVDVPFVAKETLYDRYALAALALFGNTQINPGKTPEEWKKHAGFFIGFAREIAKTMTTEPRE